MDNVIEFPCREIDPVVIEFEIGIGSVDEARRALECLDATTAVAVNLVNKTDAPDEVKLVGLRRLFDALNVLIERERERKIVPLCSLPKFPPDGAA